jgi:hypothetical protein
LLGPDRFSWRAVEALGREPARGIVGRGLGRTGAATGPYGLEPLGFERGRAAPRRRGQVATHPGQRVLEYLRLLGVAAILEAGEAATSVLGNTSRGCAPVKLDVFVAGAPDPGVHFEKFVFLHGLQTGPFRFAYEGLLVVGHSVDERPHETPLSNADGHDRKH